MRMGKERWKRLKFPQELASKNKFQVSNYGRIREVLPCGTYVEKRRIIKEFRLYYKFVLYLKTNKEDKHLYFESAKNLVASHFIPNYYKGCFVIQLDHNRLNSYFRNLKVVDKSEALSHFGKGRVSKYDQFLVIPPKEDVQYEVDHKVEVDIDFFKTIQGI